MIGVDYGRLVDGRRLLNGRCAGESGGYWSSWSTCTPWLTILKTISISTQNKEDVRVELAVNMARARSEGGLQECVVKEEKGI